MAKMSKKLNLTTIIKILLGGLHVTNPPIRLMCPTSVRLHFSFLDSNSKTVCPIEFKLDREIDHHYSYVPVEISEIPSVRLSVFVCLSIRLFVHIFVSGL